MKQKFKLLLLILLIIGCNSNNKNDFEGYIIQGKTNGLINGTTIHLFDDLTGVVVDSTKVKNNKFEFKGYLENSPSLMALKTKDKYQYKFVWMENTIMSFDASQSEFKKARFFGSELHEFVQEKLYSKTDMIEIKTKQDVFRVREIQMKFVEEFPNNIMSAFTLSVYAPAPEIPLARIKYLYKNLSTKNKQHLYGQKILKTIKTLESIDQNRIEPQIGENYVDFEMIDTSGITLKLSENLGKVTLLEFWATSCGPCIAEMPNLKKTYEIHKSNGFKIFAVSLDNSEVKWKNSIRDLKLNWINVSDLNGTNNFAAMQYGVSAIPDNFLFDSNGKIVGRNLRGENLNKELERLLN